MRSQGSFGTKPNSVAVVLACVVYVAAGVAAAGQMERFVRVSPRDCRYFELDDGTPFIPNGLNMIAPYGSEREALALMETWIEKLSANGGNYIRLWLSNGFFDVEHEKSGQYDAEKARRIDAVLEMARSRGVRVKMTIEHFRTIGGGRQSWADKPLHHVSQGGPAESMDDFFAGEKSRAQFKRKLDFYRDRYGHDPAIFSWELWNEIDAASGKGYEQWTVEMLAELKNRFPKNLVVQSLGSFDNDSKRDRYRRFSLMAGNDYAQVHRYLDLGARLEVCKGPVDVLAADAVRELLSYGCGKPVILAESGAVEPGHSGPFKLYAADTAGIILHDVLFAPFFAGSAGTGQIWHWDHYVAKNDLWRHFGGFAAAVKGIDPPTEDFQPVVLEQSSLRVYGLRGRTVFIAWLRDKANTWQSELAGRQAASVIADGTLDLGAVETLADARAAAVYDPWSDKSVGAPIIRGKISLPPFSRSVVVRVYR